MIQYPRGLTAYQWIRIATVGIMSVAAYVSYGHQRDQLLSWGVDLQSAWLVPLTVDLLAIVCNIALHIPGVLRRGFWTSLVVLVLAVAASGAVNFIAGGTLGAKFANLWTVVAYLLAEFVAISVKASRVKDPVRVAAGHAAAQTRKARGKKTTPRKPRTPKPADVIAEASKIAAVAATAPVSPAPAGRASQ